MDYTHSDAFVIHAGTGQRMHQDDQPVTTAVSPDDMNMVIWSLMEVVKSAGLEGAVFNAASPETYQVLLSAMRALYGNFTLIDEPRSTLDKLADRVNLLDQIPKSQHAAIKAGTSVYNATAAIQKLINWCSNNGFPEIEATAGLYKATKLYFHHDEINNPGYNPAAQGRVRIVGQGQLTHSAASNYPAEGIHGTVLEVTNGIVFAPAGYDADPFPARSSALARLTVVGNTTGYVLENNACPQAQLDEVTIVNRNINGHGVKWHSSWFGNWYRVWVTNSGTGAKTGRGVDFGSSIFAGEFGFSKCTFERYKTNFYAGQSSGAAVLLFDGCSFQSAAEDGLGVFESYRSLSIRDCYFEFNGRSHIRCDSTAPIMSLQIEGGFVLGGSPTATSMTSAQIYLKGVVGYQISGMTGFRLWTDFLEVYYFAANGTRGSLEAVTIDNTDAEHTNPIYLVKPDSGRVVPTLINNALLPGTTDLKDFDRATYRPSVHIDAGLECGSLALTTRTKTFSTLNEAVYLDNDHDAVTYLLTVSQLGCLIALPSGTKDGRTLRIASSVASGQNIDIKKPDGTTTLVTLLPGRLYELTYIKQLNAWMAAGPLTVAGV